MAMEDTHRLAQGLLIDGRIAQPSRIVDMIPRGPWILAEVVDVSLYVNHKVGFYFGNVRIQPEGSDRCTQHSFNELWLEGWTSVAFMNECLKAPKKSKRPRGK